MTDYMKAVYYVFRCSVCGSSHDTDGYGDGTRHSLQNAIKEMREQGWSIGKTRNICERCERKAKP